eukprot:COSAG01_NODE_12092_length_1802_cov_72.655901_4_plen_71_part_00
MEVTVQRDQVQGVLYTSKKEMQLRRIRDPMLKSIATALPHEILEMIYVLSLSHRYDLRLSTRHRPISYRC